MPVNAGPSSAKQTQAKAGTASPSPSLLQRLFGTEELSPETQQAIDIVKKENPNLAPIRPYGFISRMYQPQAQGYTSPGGTIYLNPTQLQGMSPQDIADTITHEQTHVQQPLNLLQRAFSSAGPYSQRPDEMAAFQAERERRAKTGRTGDVAAYPSFTNTGQYYVNQDTVLRNK